MSKETEMSPAEILIVVVIFTSVILVSLFLYSLLRTIHTNLEDNALKRAATEIAENIIHSDLTEDGGFLLQKLNLLDKTGSEPLRHCYAYNVIITTSQKINNKNMWQFGYFGSENDFSIELPYAVRSDGVMIPAKFKLTVYDTNAARCR